MFIVDSFCLPKLIQIKLLPLPKSCRANNNDWNNRTICHNLKIIPEN